MDNNDGPCKALNTFILEHNLDSKAAKWKGYRVLD